jgi:hypothetical protein
MSVPGEFPRVPHPQTTPRLPQRHRDDFAGRPQSRRSRGQGRVFLGQLQGRAGRYRQGQDPAPLPAGRRHRRGRPRGRLDRPGVQGRRRGAGHRQRLSETRDGGYSRVRATGIEVGRRPAAGLSLREAMILGTAGFTAALALLRMEDNRQSPSTSARWRSPAPPAAWVRWRSPSSARPATTCTRSAARPEQAGYLKSLGASEVLGATRWPRPRPMDVRPLRRRPGQRGRADAGRLLAQTAPYGNVASAGLAASHELHATVMPFIIRGVSLLGVASAGTARDMRDEVWRRLASDWKPATWTRSAPAKPRWTDFPGSSPRCWPAVRWAGPWCASRNRPDRLAGIHAPATIGTTRGTPWHAS